MKQRHITVIVVVILLAIVSTYLINSIRYPCAKERTPSPNLLNMPKYISYLWPLPQSEVQINCYFKSNNYTPSVRGVSLTINPSSIVDLEIPSKNSDTKLSFIERIYLYLDKHLVSNETRIVFDNLVGLGIIRDGQIFNSNLSSEYIVSWFPLLMPGTHTAKMIIETKSGTVLEYEWSFILK